MVVCPLFRMSFRVRFSRVIMSFFSEAVFNEHRYSQDGQTERLVLQHLLSTVCDDLLVAFEDV